jgi:hypothetical protein
MPTKPLTRFQKWVNREVRPLMVGRTMRSAVNRMESEEVFENWAILHFLEAVIAKRKEMLRERILDQCKRTGSPYTDKKGNFAGKCENRHDHEIRAQRRMSALPDEQALKHLLERKAIDFDAAFSTVRRVVMDPSKIHSLVETGKLEKTDLEKTHKVNWALLVKTAPALKKHLDALDSEKPA